MFEDPKGSVAVAQAIAAAIVAVAFLALIGLIFWRATEADQNFAEIWASGSTLLGVVLGSIPAYFFQREVRAERARSAALGDRLTGQPRPSGRQGGA